MANCEVQQKEFNIFEKVFPMAQVYLTTNYYFYDLELWPPYITNEFVHIEKYTKQNLHLLLWRNGATYELSVFFAPKKNQQTV